MNEIGGYLQLEQFSGREYYTGMRKLNLGRTAIRYAVQALKIKELWIPRYLCDSMQDACRETDCRIVEYNVTAELEPMLDDWQQDTRRWVLLVNYYGQYGQERLAAWKARYGQIIVDNTQAFFQPPLEGVPTLYSVRKFLGVPDGGYLYLPDGADETDYQKLPRDSSRTRMGHLLGRYEDCAGPYYRQMLDTAHSYCQAPILRMSPLTENLLGAIPYEQIKACREANWKQLQEGLGAFNKLTWSCPEGPLAYPFYCEQAAKIKKMLATEKIFVPTYWNNVIAQMPEDSVEYDYAAHIMPLPCDQRYGEAEMNRVIRTVLELLEKA